MLKQTIYLLSVSVNLYIIDVTDITYISYTSTP